MGVKLEALAANVLDALARESPSLASRISAQAKRGTITDAVRSSLIRELTRSIAALYPSNQEVADCAARWAVTSAFPTESSWALKLPPASSAGAALMSEVTNGVPGAAQRYAAVMAYAAAMLPGAKCTSIPEDVVFAFKVPLAVRDDLKRRFTSQARSFMGFMKNLTCLMAHGGNIANALRAVDALDERYLVLDALSRSTQAILLTSRAVGNAQVGGLSDKLRTAKAKLAKGVAIAKGDLLDMVMREMQLQDMPTRDLHIHGRRLNAVQ